MMKQITLFLIFVLHCLNLICQKNSIDNKLTIKNYQFSIDCNVEQLILHIGISVNNNKGLSLPYPPILLCDDALADLSYTIEKFDDSTKSFNHFPYMLDEIPFREIKIIHLNKGDFFFISEKIPCYFQERGRFRIKVKLNVSQYNKNQKDIYSNWLEFRIIKPANRSVQE